MISEYLKYIYNKNNNNINNEKEGEISCLWEKKLNKN